MTATVEILLATYNAARYLPELLASLESQRHSDWRLLVRDDGSQDQTIEILEDFHLRHSDQVRLIEHDGANLGPCGNFLHLLQHSSTDYIMFCDQDDIWLPDKIALTLTEMKTLEQQHGIDMPLLVHTDFQVVDDTLHIIGTSGHRYQLIDPHNGARLSRLLVQNIVTGCTTMINHQLRDLVLPVPKTALMHDHWLALATAAFGRIGYVATPTLLYRQHQDNEVGAQGWTPAYILQQLGNLTQIRKALTGNKRQAEAFFLRYQKLLSTENQNLLKAFVSLPQQNWLKRRITILTHHFYYCGLVRNIGWLLLC